MWGDARVVGVQPARSIAADGGRVKLVPILSRVAGLTKCGESEYRKCGLNDVIWNDVGEHLCCFNHSPSTEDTRSQAFLTVESAHR